MTRTARLTRPPALRLWLSAITLLLGLHGRTVYAEADKPAPPAQLPAAASSPSTTSSSPSSSPSSAAAAPAPASSATAPASGASPAPAATAAPPAAASVPEPPPAPTIDPDVEPAPAPLLVDPKAPGPILTRIPTPEEKKEALAFLQQGLLYFQQKDFDKAIGALEKAYNLDPQPLLLFNMGQAQRKAGHPREALVLYQRFVETAPQHPLRPEAEGYVLDMKALILEQEQGEVVRRRLAVEQKAAEEKQRALLIERERTGKAELLLTQEREKAERERKKPIYKRGWFWGVMAASAAVVGLSVGLGVAFRPKETPTDGGFLDGIPRA